MLAGLSTSDISSIMQYGGPVVMLIFMLVSAIVVLWKHYLAQVKSWTESQLEDNKAMIEVAERSTNAIANLTELLRTASTTNSAYQAEMRSKVETALAELRQFRLEMSELRYRGRGH